MPLLARGSDGGESTGQGKLTFSCASSPSFVNFCTQARPFQPHKQSWPCCWAALTLGGTGKQSLFCCFWPTTEIQLFKTIPALLFEFVSNRNKEIIGLNIVLVKADSCGNFKPDISYHSGSDIKGKQLHLISNISFKHPAGCDVLQAALLCHWVLINLQC